MDISESHMGSKGEAYWKDLTAGNTGKYKSQIMESLVREHFKAPKASLIDIGCGTCEEILKYSKLLSATKLTCTDYDPAIVAEMKAKNLDARIEWRVADIFALDRLGEGYDLVFLMDVIHEIYSFYGRPDRNIQTAVDHTLGMHYVHEAFKQVATIVNKGGGIIVTDDVLCNSNIPVSVRIKNQATSEAVRYFISDYPTKRIQVNWVGPMELEILSRDLNILLTQYNKIKVANWSRWAIERLEIHEYMSPDEYKSMFTELGFDLHMVVGTPEAARQEWASDFEIISGMDKLPEKRVTLLAIKK